MGKAGVVVGTNSNMKKSSSNSCRVMMEKAPPAMISTARRQVNSSSNTSSNGRSKLDTIYEDNKDHPLSLGSFCSNNQARTTTAAD